MPQERHEFVVEDTRRREVAALIKALVVPRPIAWVSSRSPEGVDNLAPHSFFTVVSMVPPLVAFVSSGRKDSVRNIEATGEFVVSVTPASVMEQVNITGTSFPPDVSEFDQAKVTREPAATVDVARVAESPAALECSLHSIVELGDGLLVVGQVRHIAVAEHVLTERGGGLHPEIESVNPVSRLGLDEWGVLGEIHALTREKPA